MKHSKLKTLARRLMTQQEIKDKVKIFQSAGWERRKQKIHEEAVKRIAKQQATSKARAEKRESLSETSRTENKISPQPPQ